MTFVSRRRLATCAVGAVLLPAAVAGAATSTSFPDPTGDAVGAFDITRVDVSETDDTIRVWAVIKGADGCVVDGRQMWVDVAFDTDQNPDTGSAFYGTEYELASNEWQDFRFLRARGWDLREVTAPNGWSVGCGPDEAGYSIYAPNLGLAPGQGFNVVVSTEGRHPDTAPDIRTFNFQPLTGTQPPPVGRDVRPPHVMALPARAVHGKVATLRYRALDGRGQTADTVRVYRGRRLLQTIRRPLRDSNPFIVSQVLWRVPARARGELRFSVRAVDAAGNPSATSSAALHVR